MQYRPEIDGLRAVAVIPVIFFHAGFSAFSGGYIGVDIFFVISGYLITSIILAEKETGTFRLVRFYERRARRILPALFFMMVVSLPFAWLWLMPTDLKKFSDSLIAVATFSSNVLFWQESGYFDTASELKPLLHTWSLAVEEQYYVLFPLFLIIAWRLGKRSILAILVVGAILSLAVAQWGSAAKPTATFFLLPTRGWELLIGVFAAFHLFGKHAIRGNQALSLLGLLMIAGAVFAFDKTVPFPSLYALIPTLGTVLIILFTSADTWVYRILANRLFVGIGLISYSAYLWHQPLFVFARHRSLQDPSPQAMIALAFAAIGLAYISWRFVEMPFRNRNLFTRKQVFAFSGAVTSVFILTGSIGHLNNGFANRFHNTVIAQTFKARATNEHHGKICRIETGKRIVVPKKRCWYGKGTKKILMWGDSHTDTIVRILPSYLKNTTIYQAAYSACPPLPNVTRVDSTVSRCHAFNKKVFDWAKTQNFDAILLSARWRLYQQGTGFDDREGGIEKRKIAFARLNDRSANSTDRKPLDNAITQGIETIAKTFSNIPVILVYQIPEAGWDVPSEIFKRIRFSKYDGTLSTSFATFQKANAESSAALDAVKAGNLVRIRPSRTFCNSFIENRCILAQGQSIFYSDWDHVTMTGARLLAKAYARGIEHALKLVSD